MTHTDLQIEARLALTEEAKAAIKGSQNTQLIAVGPGAVMLVTPYGPAGILYKRPDDYLWHRDGSPDATYPSLSIALIVALADAERLFTEMEALHGEQSAAAIEVLQEGLYGDRG